MTKNTTKAKRIEGDSFIICTFGFTHGPYVIESGNSLSQLMTKLPEALVNEESRVSVCSVGWWIENKSDPSDAFPKGLETLFEVQPYNIEDHHLDS